MEGRKILVNQIECLKCGDKPYSSHRHDFKYCKCESVAADGGMDYLRRSGDPDSYLELSIIVPDDLFKAMHKALTWCDENGRNNLGRICAIARKIRDAGFYIEESTEDKKSEEG